MKKVVVIEDDKDIAELVGVHLEDQNCVVRTFHNGKKGFEHASNNDFDLLILDINLPGMNGIEICRKLREANINDPILMLTARSEEIDKVLGLESGADDYLSKPFGVREFVARVNVIFRRQDRNRKVEESDTEVIKCRELAIDKRMRKVTLDGVRVDLTPKEFDLLYLLASNPGVTYDRKDLLNLVWNYDFEGYEHTVNSHINRLRSKIEETPNNPKFVLTTWGVGYRFCDI